MVKHEPHKSNMKPYTNDYNNENNDDNDDDDNHSLVSNYTDCYDEINDRLMIHSSPNSDDDEENEEEEEDEEEEEEKCSPYSGESTIYSLDSATKELLTSFTCSKINDNGNINDNSPDCTISSCGGCEPCRSRTITISRLTYNMT